MFGRGTLSCQTVKSPVIILGMHRSGTTLVAELLRELGLHQGRGVALNEHCEPVFFVETNDQLLRLGSATWDQPEPFNELLRHSSLSPGVLPSLKARVERSLGQIAPHSVPAWGWKDPRTVYTLPLWLKLFPDAKLLYIMRNGVDVAASLRTREVQRQESRIRRDDARHKIRDLDDAFVGSARCLTLDGAFGLWEEYVAQAERALAACDNERLEVQYEALLADPAKHTRAMAEFCDLPVDNAALAKATAGVKPARANAWMGNPELAKFYRGAAASSWMHRFSYAPGEASGPRPEWFEEAMAI